MTEKLGRLMERAGEMLGGLKDRRQASNATKYTMKEIGMGALSVFVMQDPSFLSQQERLAKGKTGHNFNTLFGCEKIPTANHIRCSLDATAPEEIEDLYHSGFEELSEEKALEPFKMLGGVLIVHDGTCGHSSSKIHCKNCSKKNHKSGEVTYSHSVLCTAIVSTNINEAIPLPPEFIRPQDGHKKQDCENAAFKRWFQRHKDRYRHLKPTMLGDDLFAKQPICEMLDDEGYKFIYTCKPDSHKTLYEHLDGIQLESWREITKVGYKKIKCEYRFMNKVPIKDGKDAMLVNWFEMIVTSVKSGKVLYRNAFITNHEITPSSIREIGTAARAKWKIENENNNTLKTKGYRFEHSYGHGKNNLSMVLMSMAIVAFLYHTVANLIDSFYMEAKTASRTRIDFFDKLRAFTGILVFASWASLMTFLKAPPDLSPMVGII